MMRGGGHGVSPEVTSTGTHCAPCRLTNTSGPIEITDLVNADAV